MEFGLNKEQEMMRNTIREFALKEIEPIAAEIDENATFPTETVTAKGVAAFTDAGASITGTCFSCFQSAV